MDSLFLELTTWRCDGLVKPTSSLAAARSPMDKWSNKRFHILTDYMQNVCDVIAHNRKINSSKVSVLATYLYAAS